jgi:hypothetical protein
MQSAVTTVESGGLEVRRAYSSESLEGAIMPNGQKYEDWLKSREGDRG